MHLEYWFDRNGNKGTIYSKWSPKYQKAINIRIVNGKPLSSEAYDMSTKDIMSCMKQEDWIPVPSPLE